MMLELYSWRRGQVVKRDAFQAGHELRRMGQLPLRNVWRETEYDSKGPWPGIALGQRLLTLLSPKAALFNGLTPADAITGDIGFRAYLSAIRVGISIGIEEDGFARKGRPRSPNICHHLIPPMGILKIDPRPRSIFSDGPPVRPYLPHGYSISAFLKQQSFAPLKRASRSRENALLEQPSFSLLKGVSRAPDIAILRQFAMTCPIPPCHRGGLFLRKSPLFRAHRWGEASQERSGGFPTPGKRIGDLPNPLLQPKGRDGDVSPSIASDKQSMVIED